MSNPEIPEYLALLILWERAKKNGITMKKFAKRYGLKRKQMDNRLQRARRKRKELKDSISSIGEAVGVEIGETAIEDEVDKNKRRVTYVSPDIRTIEDLKRDLDIDENEWVIYRHKINKWPMGAKLGNKNLEYKDGKIIKGRITPDEAIVVPLIQVTAWMVKREPEAIKPAIKAARIEVSFTNPPIRRSKEKPITVFVIPDIQFGYRRDIRNGKLDPFHSRRVLDIYHQVLQDHKFDRVIQLGDELDWTGWSSRFVKDAEFYFTTQPAIDEFVWWFAQYRKSQPDARFDLLDSNHANRLDAAINTHLVDAAGLRPGGDYEVRASLSIPYLLSLDKLGIMFHEGYPEHRLRLTDGLYVQHGNVARAKPGHTSSAMGGNLMETTVFGHIHRIERSTYTREMGGRNRFIEMVSPGCACRLDYVVPGHKPGDNWQNGFGVIEYTDNGFVDIKTYLIQQNGVIFGGKVYRGRNRLDEIRQDLSDYNFGDDDYDKLSQEVD